jgi:hypothetical protein
MLIATVPILVAIVGLLMYVLAGNPKVAEIGRIMFAAGLLVALFAIGQTGAVRILP